ncbi:MAG: CAP domain-containing protein [Blastocatellia bacterium]
MTGRFSLSLIIVVLALATAVYPQQGGQKPARVDSSRVERQPRAVESSGEEDERNVYTDDDVLSRREPRDARLSEIESLEIQCFNEVNQVRVKVGLMPLEFNEPLLRVAREYSRRMAEENFFSHNDPNGNTVRERVSEANIRWRVLGENLSYSRGYINPVAVSMTGWMDSPGHRRNLLDRTWRQTAIGAWISNNGTVYFTEIFLSQ